MKTLGGILMAAALLSSPFAHALNCDDYSHWDCSDPKLKIIDAFIESHANKNYVAAFDWDGTLYDENIALKKGDPNEGEQRSGQSVWHLWGANENIFPLFETQDRQYADNVVMRDDFVEGKTDISPEGYSKFNFISMTEAGLTPKEMYEAESRYMQSYKPEDYAYLPMLDVFQQLKNKGYQVWVITGSNPYFVNNIMNYLDETLGYNLVAKGCESSSFDLENCNIMGNGAKLSSDGKFSFVYDNRFVKNSGGQRFVVDGEGKEVAINNYLLPRAKEPMVMYVGNSGGDFEAMEYVLSQEDVDVLGISVNPRGTLEDLVTRYERAQQMVVLEMG
jgi:hypothetical protein